MTQRLMPISWNALVGRLRNIGFAGPYRSGKHYFMTKAAFRLTIPNPHRQDIGVPLLSEILARAGIAHEEWLKATKK
ncbi:MAG: type II toxin-antitoxin system HicA family toxin [Chloroflexi bacterium]|nr:type II toxin-antitoxin system HicA family toxin [Chloroflexota bacterium]